MINQSD